MPRVLADGTTRFVIFETKPADPKNITVAEFAAAKDASCNVLSTGFSFGPGELETIDEKPLCKKGTVQAPGNQSANVAGTIFRYFTEAGVPDPDADWLFDMHREVGNTVYGAALKSRGKQSGEAVVAGEEYNYIEYTTGQVMDQDDATGWTKNPFTGLPQDYYFNQKVVAATP